MTPSSASGFAPKLAGQIPSLDGFRAISIALVIAGHAYDSTNAPPVLRYISHLGNYGVRCFFVISGFLITTLLLREWDQAGRFSLKKFYVRRTLRIFPAAFTYIGIIAICYSLHWLSLKPGDLIHAVTYTINYRYNPAHWFRHLWSLSVEEQFYLLWPGTLWLVGRRWGARVALAGVILGPIIRALMLVYFGASDSAMTKHFEAIADTLAIGCLLSIYFNRLGEILWYRRLQSSPVFWIIALTLVIGGNGLYAVRPVLFYTAGQSLANAGTALCIDWAIRNPNTGISVLLNRKPVVYIGTISYSLYLYQNAFLNPDWSAWASRLPENLVLIAAASLCSYYLVESPFQRLKRRAGATVADSR